MKKFKIIFIADIFGDPGLEVMTRMLPGLIRSKNADFVIANGENGADGKGLTAELVSAYYAAGIDVITSGNHIFDKAPLRKEFRNFPNLLRPMNYPPGSGGHGLVTVKSNSGVEITVINLQGRTYMSPIDCPFRMAERELTRLKSKSPVIFIDFHAESTAEKQAFAWHLDGKVSAIVGTHTHVQTADEKISPAGTGYITDAGMTGAFDSVIGLMPNVAIHRFITQTPQPFIIAKDNLHLNGVFLEVDPETGHCIKIERISLP
mgnify:CR=1 FL=1